MSNPILGAITTVPLEAKLAGFDKFFQPGIMVKDGHDR